MIANSTTGEGLLAEGALKGEGLVDPCPKIDTEVECGLHNDKSPEKYVGSFSNPLSWDNKVFKHVFNKMPTLGTKADSMHGRNL